MSRLYSSFPSSFSGLFQRALIGFFLALSVTFLTACGGSKSSSNSGSSSGGLNLKLKFNVQTFDTNISNKANFANEKYDTYGILTTDKNYSSSASSDRIALSTLGFLKHNNRGLTIEMKIYYVNYDKKNDRGNPTWELLQEFNRTASYDAIHDGEIDFGTFRTDHPSLKNDLNNIAYSIEVRDPFYQALAAECLIPDYPLLINWMNFDDGVISGLEVFKGEVQNKEPFDLYWAARAHNLVFSDLAHYSPMPSQTGSEFYYNRYQYGYEKINFVNNKPSGSGLGSYVGKTPIFLIYRGRPEQENGPVSITYPPILLSSSGSPSVDTALDYFFQNVPFDWKFPPGSPSEKCE